MKLYNTNTRSVETVQPLNNDTITFYACGPTVYATPHIGNWIAYIRWDILARTIRQHYKLDWYINITDVGHLVSDADDGEDKLEKGARREGKTAWQVAEYYTSEFIAGLNELNISIDQSHLVKATDHISEQIDLIKQLEAKGYTYVIDDGVYFDSSRFADYGKMARLDLEGLQAGARVDLGNKKHATDFALWKFSPKDAHRDMEWESPWGVGFPGWHIECSAMAMKYLGETLDIHSGGIDHIPVHHTNEIAQSEGATGKQFVRTWVHSNFLQVDGNKLSKSLQNSYTLDDLQERGFAPMVFKMFVLQSHFQTEANFTWEGLRAAQTRLQELQAVADLRFQLLSGESENEQAGAFELQLTEYIKKIKDDLDNNLNTPKVVATLSAFVQYVDANRPHSTTAQSFNQTLATIDELLGLSLLKSTDLQAEQYALIAKRTAAREKKDWSTSDALRDQLQAQGIGLNDTPAGTVWYRL